MIGYINTTLLLLFLLCVTKPLQAENETSTEKLTSSSDSEGVESKGNVSESSTLKSLEKLESTTENGEKTTEASPEEGEEKKSSVLKDEIKTAKEKKGNHTLRRKRRSHISGIKKKYTRDEFDDSEESKVDMHSGFSDTDKDDFDSDSEVYGSPEIYDSGEDNDDDTVSHKNDEGLINFLKKFLDDSCVVIESFSSLQNSIENILVQMDKMGIIVQVDPDAIMSYLSNFKEDWEEYCESPKETNDALEFFNDFLYKVTKHSGFDGSDDDPSTVELDLSNDDTMKRFLNPHLISSLTNIIKGLVGGQTRAETKRQDNPLVPVMTFLHKFVDGLDLPPPVKAFVSALSETLGGNKRSNNLLATLSSFVNTYGGAIDNMRSLIAGLDAGKRSDGGSDLSMFLNSEGRPFIDLGTAVSAKRSEDKEPSLEKVLQKYCELSRGSSNIIMTLKALLKEFDVSDEPEASRRLNIDFMKFFNSLKTIVKRNGDVTKRSGYEATFVKEVMDKYCEGIKRSDTSLTSISKVLVPQEGNNTRRATFVPSKTLLDNSIKGSEGSVDVLDYLKYFLANYCEVPDPNTESLDSANKRIALQRTVKRPVRPKVRTKSNKTDSVSGERRSKRSEYDDMIGWRHGVFEHDKDQNVSNRPTEKSSPRIIRKSKIRILKKPKNLKNRIINLYSAKENGTRTRGQRGQFSKVKIIGHKETPSTSFEVKTGVERDMGSDDSNPRLRCNVRTKGSMSDTDGRTGSSKGHTFSEVPSNDTKALLCSSETSEVHRPNKDVYIKQSVSGKSIVSYDSPDKYIRHNYSPSKENLEIGTSGFSTLNDTSSKNQSISVVSTDSQNADSISRSETKFVQDGSQRGMESSANVEGSIDAVPNKNPFITNSRQHSLGTIIENPDKNMESPLPVEQNEKLQTYSKFQRTEDFDITFRRFNPERSRTHRRRPR